MFKKCLQSNIMQKNVNLRMFKYVKVCKHNNVKVYLNIPYFITYDMFKSLDKIYGFKLHN